MTSGSEPLISIVTPTFPGRERELIERCMLSVDRLDWERIQHVIVSDRKWPPLWIEPRRRGVETTYVQINETWRNPTTSASTGSYPWMIGSRLAMGEFVGFLGDDDELLPHHVRAHVRLMREHEAMFSISQVEFRVAGQHYCVIGTDESEWHKVGSMDATGIMCHKDALRHGIWDANGNNAGDWQMVQAWRAAGMRGAYVDQITGIHHDGWAAGKSGRPDQPD